MNMELPSVVELDSGVEHLVFRFGCVPVGFVLLWEDADRTAVPRVFHVALLRFRRDISERSVLRVKEKSVGHQEGLRGRKGFCFAYL